MHRGGRGEFWVERARHDPSFDHENGFTSVGRQDFDVCAYLPQARSPNEHSLQRCQRHPVGASTVASKTMVNNTIVNNTVVNNAVVNNAVERSDETIDLSTVRVSIHGDIEKIHARWSLLGRTSEKNSAGTGPEHGEIAARGARHNRFPQSVELQEFRECRAFAARQDEMRHLLELSGETHFDGIVAEAGEFLDMRLDRTLQRQHSRANGTIDRSR